MKKVLISSITDYNNYGNRLQAYALQQVIKKMNFNVWHLKNKPQNNLIKERKDILNSISAINILKRIVNFIRFRRKNKLKQQRSVIFKRFTAEYIRETDFTMTNDNLLNFNSENYDYFITGSDQVWNPNFRYCSPIDFLTFAPEKRRISYSASFGISNIPEDIEPYYSKKLNEIPNISVREESGSEIVKKLTGRNVPVVLDPTLLLTRQEWDKVTKESINKPKKNYLVTYFIGGIPAEYNETINNFSEKYDLEIVSLNDINIKEKYLEGPSEFLDYIKDAKLVCTDSYHSIIFSIIFESPFIIFKRQMDTPSMYSRIETILKMFKFEDRTFENINEKNIFDIEFETYKEILEQEKIKSLNFLNESLDNDSQF